VPLLRRGYCWLTRPMHLLRIPGGGTQAPDRAVEHTSAQTRNIMKLLSLRDRPSSTPGLLWATLVVSALALTGCGKKDEPVKPAAAPAAAATAGKSAAQVAVDAAKPLCTGGKTITIVWEAGLQSLDPKNFSGPKWEQATGCKVSVVEVPTAEMFTKIMQEFRAGTGAYDALNVIPAWMPDLAQAGALEPLDALVDKYGFRDELKTIAPTYRDNQMTVGGKIYGFPDDGDVFLMYYRKDLFAREDLQKAYKEQFKADLAVPKTWDEFKQVGTFFTDKLKGEGIYGASMFREPGYGNFMFQERFRNEGGKFFDANLKATINTPQGLKVLKGWLDENKFMPKGVEKFGFVENLAVFLKGESAMTISWPPYGRFAAGYLANEKALDWVPKSQVAGKVGYALPPGGHPELAAGFALSVASTSKNKEAAYLFIQWLNSEEVSSQRVKLPYALRDPFRDSHFKDPGYMALWPDAKDYLAALGQGAQTGLLDLSLIQTDKYEEALRQGISKLWAGEDPQKILDKVAADWDAVTQQVGVDKQKAVYEAWAAKSGAYPK
jgi:multiple sugar transport system substrate-binding protein